LILWKRNWKNAFIRVIVPAGYPDYDYHDPVVTTEVTDELMDSFWKLIREKVLNDNQIRYDEVQIPGIQYPGKDDMWNKDKDVCPYTDLSEHESYSKFISTLKKSLRHDVEKKSRRLKEYGDLKYYCYKPNEVSSAINVLPEFLAAHVKRWPNAYKAPGLHKAILLQGIPSGLVHFSELRLDDTVIDWNLGYQYKKRFYYYMSTSPYLEKYVKYSPGKVHLAHLIQDSFENGVQIFDYLRGAHGYKGEWTDKCITLYCSNYKKSGLINRIRLSTYASLSEIKK
jgi:CelD/BcsL family acetyltransferase involved in cellulose biosynthesis